MSELSIFRNQRRNKSRRDLKECCTKWRQKQQNNGNCELYSSVERLEIDVGQGKIKCHCKTYANENATESVTRSRYTL